MIIITVVVAGVVYVLSLCVFFFVHFFSFPLTRHSFEQHGANSYILTFFTFALLSFNSQVTDASSVLTKPF